MHKGTDQASGLRQLLNPAPVKVVAVTSGKGGVGKSSVSTNLAVAWAGIGREVMLMDADLALANVDVMLGLQPKHNLSHVVAGEVPLSDIILTGPRGVRVVPAASGIKQMARLSELEQAGLIQAFSDLTDGLDVLIVDTAAGISESVVTFSRAAHEVIVVVCDEPASITDSYALIKVLSRDYRIPRFQILSNMTRTPREGRELFMKIARVTSRFLDVTVDYLGHIPFDEHLRMAVREQRPVADAYPAASSALAFRRIVQKADGWALPKGSTGRLEFFAERFIGRGNAVTEVSP